MTINEQNYEAFFLDYLEGRLTPEQVSDVLLFAENHPELKAELEAFQSLTLNPADSTIFPAKNDLKQVDLSTPITPANEEDYFIAHLEKDLNSTQEVQLENYLIDFPKKRNVFELFQKTTLKADLQQKFIPKKSLKKSNPVMVRLYWSAAALAACWLIAFNVNQKTDVLNSSASANYSLTEQGGDTYFIRKGFNMTYHPLLNFVQQNSDQEYNVHQNEGINQAKVVVQSIEDKQELANNKTVEQGKQFKEIIDQPAVVIPNLTSDSVDRVVTNDQLPKQELMEQQAEENLTMASTNVQEADKEFQTIDNYITEFVKQKILGENEIANAEDVSIGEAVSSRVTKAVGGELIVEKNKEGAVLAYAFKLGKFELSRKNRKN